METLIETFNTIVASFNFREAKVTVDEEHRRVSVVIDDDVAHANLSSILASLDCIFNLILRKAGKESYVVDVNYYRRERERLIGELARAAAKKAMISKQDVELPPMNSYERRLVHMEITTHPELRTESAGEGKERHVIIKRIEE
jgi:predicted RNA-binding protein Jag